MVPEGNMNHGDLLFAVPRATIGVSNFTLPAVCRPSLSLTLRPRSRPVSASTGLRMVTEATPTTVNYATFDYQHVGNFTPLSPDNWYSVTKIVSCDIDGWTATLQVEGNPRTYGQGSTETHQMKVQLTSKQTNSFRVLFDPNGPLDQMTSGPIAKEQLDWIQAQESTAGEPSPLSYDPTQGLTFMTQDLKVELSPSCSLKVTRLSDGFVIMEDAEDNGVSLGLVYVKNEYGNAVASVKKNYKGDSYRAEHFYGAGEVQAKYQNNYIVERSGLAMTNFNYDILGFNQPGVVPPGQPQGDVNYYLPTYFTAPWIVVNGCQAQTQQYAYGLFLDNASQTYMNTGDTAFNADGNQYNGQPDKYYLGAQYGRVDLHFIYGQLSQYGHSVENPVRGFAYLMGKDYTNPSLNKRAVMPPKYIFGFFQGVFGASGVTASAVGGALPDNGITLDTIVSGYQDNDIPLEGLAVDVDVQDELKVFTTKGAFWDSGTVGKGQSVFDWAHTKGLVCQTNITCFIKKADNYSVYSSLYDNKIYTENIGVDGGTFNSGLTDPAEPYLGYLNYGGTGPNVEAIAAFPDWGKPGAAEWWGANYKDLLDLGLDFVWQDMTVPAMAPHLRYTDLRQMYSDLSNIELNDTFNWKSYHPQVQLTDMRYDDGRTSAFIALRNIHAYTLCAATKKYGLEANKSSMKKFKRSFIIARGGIVGNQHFGGMWTGDNITQEPYLDMMVPKMINMSMTCMPIAGSDVGGFAGEKDKPASPALMTRWVQASFLMPWFRDHYDRWTGAKQHGKVYQELYVDQYNQAIPGLAGGTTYRTVMKSAIELRYRWQEVLYTSMYLNATVGAPFIKSTVMYNNDPELIDVQNDEFFVGGHDGFQILAAPLLSESAQSRRVYLPKGSDWFQYNLTSDESAISKSDVKTGGSNYDDFWVPYDNTPLFVREGTILPVRYPWNGRNKSINTYTENDPLVFEVFSLAGGQGLMYLDDGGKTTNAEDAGAFGVVNLDGSTSSRVTGSVQLKMEKTDYTWSSTFYLRVRCVGNVTAITAGTDSLGSVMVSSKYDFFNQTPECYWIDTNTKSVWISLNARRMVDTSITITCSDAIYN